MPSIRATVTSTARGDTGRFIANRITPAVRASVDESNQHLLETAQGLVHVRSGDLRDSGKTMIKEYGNRIVGYVIFTAEHAGFNEFGTGLRGESSPGAGPYPYNQDWAGMVAIPFMRPALDIERDNIRRSFKSNLSASLIT